MRPLTMKTLPPRDLFTAAAARGLASAALVAWLFAPLGVAQESTGTKPATTPPKQEAPAKQGGEKPKEAKKKKDESLRELDPLGGSGPAGGGGSEEEMRELFIKVDKRLKRVSELLFEASTGDNSRSSEVGAAGIDELIRGAESSASAGNQGISQILEASRSQSEAASSEIDRILEIAAQNSPPGGGGQGQPPPSSPQEGMPQQGQTPSGSKREDKGETPSGEKPNQEQPNQENQDGETPQGGQEQKGSEDGPGKPQPKSETGDPSDATGTDDWGDLPVHLRKTFQNGVSDDVPPRYRDWVDSYYKRLNRRSGGK